MVGRWFFMIIGTIFSITPAFVYWLAGYLAIQGDPSAPTIGDIVAFTTLQSRLFFPLGQLLNVQVEIQGALALFDRIFEYLEMDPEIVDAPDAVALRPGDGRAARSRFHDVSFRYPTEAVPARSAWPRRRRVARTPTTGDGWRRRRTAMRAAARDARTMPDELETACPAFALEHVDFEAEPGELVALVGPSGSGKTTTTYLIPRLYDVDSGAVEIDGIDVRRIKLQSLGEIDRRRDPGDVPVPRVGPREPACTPEARGDRGGAATPPRAAAAIHDRIMELPEGYDTVVGERGYKLSGGEKQRIAIARVAPEGPADPDPRRGDVGPRHCVRAAHPGRVRAADGGPDDDRDRAPPLDDPARGPDPRRTTAGGSSSAARTPS